MRPENEVLTLLLFHSMKDDVSFFQSYGEDHSDNADGDDLTAKYTQHDQRKRHRIAIRELDHKGHDQGIGYDWRDRSGERVLVPKKIGKDCSYQSCQCAEHDIQRDAAAKKVSKKAPYRDTGDRSRGKDRKDHESFCHTDLYRTEGDRCEYI